MSHWATIQTQIKDIAALKEACAELKLALVEKAEARGYADRNIPGEYVIKLKGPYDIAVNPQKDGTFGLTTDWYQEHVEKEVGKNYGRLLQFYGVHKTIREARRKGFTVRRKVQHDGAIKLTLTGIGV